MTLNVFCCDHVPIYAQMFIYTCSVESALQSLLTADVQASDTH